MTNLTAPTCSTSSSPASTKRLRDQLDNDHLHNAAIRTPVSATTFDLARSRTGREWCVGPDARSGMAAPVTH
jgi:hypothetical protein